LLLIDSTKQKNRYPEDAVGMRHVESRGGSVPGITRPAKFPRVSGNVRVSGGRFLIARGKTISTCATSANRSPFLPSRAGAKVCDGFCRSACEEITCR